MYSEYEFLVTTPHKSNYCGYINYCTSFLSKHHKNAGHRSISNDIFGTYNIIVTQSDVSVLDPSHDNMELASYQKIMLMLDLS
jgi:hypothetical protein